MYGTNIIRIEDKIKTIAKDYAEHSMICYTKLNYKETAIEQIIEEAQTSFLTDRKDCN